MHRPYNSPASLTDGFDLERQLPRRSFLGRTSLGLGATALASLLGSPGDASSAEPLRVGTDPKSQSLGLPPGIHGMPHIPPTAKRVIFLCMAGGPSHLETFDEKPKLAELHGQAMPESFTKGQPIAQLQGQQLACQAPLFSFRNHGESGLRISDVLPQIASVADELCVIRSLHTDQINHDPAHTVMNTGASIPGRPSMGAWITYGLGSEAANLPAFIVLTSEGGRNPQPIASRQWGSGFLPGRFQGIEFRSQGDPVHHVQNPRGIDVSRQRDVIDTVAQLNRLQHQAVDDPEIATRISQYEMAFRMQMSVPELMQISDEPRHVLDMYGVEGADGSFAYNCLLARRMAERGVRFIHLYHRGWDHHNDLVHFMKVCAGMCDSPTAALIRDLKQRDMLRDTLIVWGGEFGRTPMAQKNKGGVGRDHHMRGFSMFLCGGGIRGGMAYGNTDELGYNAAENIVHINDLHATMLHVLGINHERLNYRFQGRDFRLTDVAGKVIHDVLA